MPFDNTSDFSHFQRSSLGEFWDSLFQPMGTQDNRIVLDQSADLNSPNCGGFGAPTAFKSCLQGLHR